MQIKGLHFDDVNGQIIGGNYGQAWLTYDGRRQGKTIYPKNREEADRLLHGMVEDIKKECGSAFTAIYPSQKWRYNYSGI